MRPDEPHLDYKASSGVAINQESRLYQEDASVLRDWTCSKDQLRGRGGCAPDPQRPRLPWLRWWILLEAAQQEGAGGVLGAAAGCAVWRSVQGI